MPRLADVIDVLNGWYDPRWAESWDAVGLVCGDPAADVARIALAVDAVPVTVGDAIAAGADLLLTHHPLLLTGVHGVPADTPKGALVHRMIRAGLAHFVAHTNADVADRGVSDALAHRLGLEQLRPLQPLGSSATVGTGRVGQLPAATSLAAFTDHVAARLPRTVWGVRAAGDPDREVRTVAVCGGSGGSLAGAARAAGADVLVTADLKHHPVVEEVAERSGSGVTAGIALVDAAHWATEAPWLDDLAIRLRDRFGTSVDIEVSRRVTDPWTLHSTARRSEGDM